jgi:uncharacterized protein (TIRG00374 family)
MAREEVSTTPDTTKDDNAKDDVARGDAPARKPSRARTLLLFGLKVVLATILIGWLVRSGSLKFSALGVLLDPPWLLVVNFAVFGCIIALATARWRSLLGLANAKLSWGRAFRLHMVAVFFNTVIPGNVGGDVLKALYVARDEDASKRPAILLIVILERALGLAGLLLLGGLVVATRAPMLLERGLGTMVWTVLGLAASSLLGLIGLTVAARLWGAKLIERTAGPSRLAKLLNQILRGMVLLSARPRVLALALAQSMALHALSMAYFTLLARYVSGTAVSYGDVATVFPLGLLTIVLPISPAGFGVGHLAFDRLFALVGLQGGATIFNVFLIGQIAGGFTGIIPYLTLKRETGPDVT